MHHRLQRRLPLRILLGLGAIGFSLTLFSSIPPATAHSELVAATPDQGQVLASLPRTIELTFNQEIAPEFAMVTIAPASAASEAVALQAVVDGPTVTASVPNGAIVDPTPGRWRTAYRVTSADGHPIEGQVVFRLDPPMPSARAATDTSTPTDGASDTAAAKPSPSPTAAEAEGSPWASTLIIGAIALIVTAAVVVLLRRKSEEE